MRVQVALLSGHAAFIEAEADWSIQKFRRRAQAAKAALVRLGGGTRIDFFLRKDQ